MVRRAFALLCDIPTRLLCFSASNSSIAVDGLSRFSSRHVSYPPEQLIYTYAVSGYRDMKVEFLKVSQKAGEARISG